MNRPFLLLLAVAAAGSGCRKPLPSPDYIEASNHYTSLLAVQGDDAYSSKDMDDVTAQLARVPAKSSDYNAAIALIATIAAQRARVATASTKVLEAPPPPPIFPTFAPIAVPDEPVLEAAADAAVSELARGGDFAVLQNKYVGCLSSRGVIAMISPDGGSSDTEGWELHDDASCRSRLPGVGANVLLVQKGKIAYLLPKAAFTTVVVPALEDGGAAVPTP